MKIKPWTVTVNKVRYRCTKAVCYLSDYAEYDYNHPMIHLTMADVRRETPEWGDTIGVPVVFQRHLHGIHQRADGYAQGVMDTARRWSHAYGGHVELAQSGRFDLVDRPFAMRHEDAVRVATARALARAIHADDGPKTDECTTALRALAALGVPCGIFYSPWEGGRHEITDEIIQRFSLRANERALQAGIVDPESPAE